MRKTLGQGETGVCLHGPKDAADCSMGLCMRLCTCFAKCSWFTLASCSDQQQVAKFADKHVHGGEEEGGAWAGAGNTMVGMLTGKWPHFLGHVAKHGSIGHARGLPHCSNQTYI